MTIGKHMVAQLNNFAKTVGNVHFLTPTQFNAWLMHRRDWCIYCLFCLFVYEQTRSPYYEHTHSAERMLIKTDKTERSTRH